MAVVLHYIKRILCLLGLVHHSSTPMTRLSILAAAASSVLPAMAYAAANSSFEDMLARTSEWNSNFNWTTCSQSLYPNLDTSVSYSCANFTIPLDWANESAGQGSLALIRIAAIDQETKKGSIFINPGKTMFAYLG